MTSLASPAPVRAPSPRQRAVAAVVLLWLLVQIAVPLWLLRYPPPVRFGWQMYAGFPERPRLTVFHADGQRRQLSSRRYFAYFRLDLTPGYEPRLATVVCRTRPQIVAVEVTPSRGKQAQRYTCVRPERRE